MSKINSAYESCRTPNPSLPRRVWHMNQRKPEAQWLGRFNQHLKSENQKVPDENSSEIFKWAPIKFKFWLSYPADTEFWQSTEFFSCPLSLPPSLAAIFHSSPPFHFPFSVWHAGGMGRAAAFSVCDCGAQKNALGVLLGTRCCWLRSGLGVDCGLINYFRCKME